MSLQKIAPEAFAVFKKSILPAKLAVTHNNGDLLLKQVQKNLGRVPDESVPELAAALKEAATQISSKLEWTVLPKKLTANPNRSENPHALDKGVRTQQGKNVEAKAAYEKLQKDSRTKIINMIYSFNPPAKRGGVDRRIKDDVEKQLLAHLAAEEARKVDLSKVVPVIREFIETKYREVERAIERM